MRVVTIVVGLLILSGVVIVGFANVDRTASAEFGANLIELAPLEVETDQFERAYGVRPITFPEDLGAHPTFQTEWWYYTGNLLGQDGNRYGFQLTFFRRALAAQPVERSSEWAGNQIYFAHFALTDVAQNTFHHYERFSRGGANLAGAQSVPYRVWLEDWEAREIESGLVQLKAREGDVALDLLIEPVKPPVLQGDRGFSPKSDQPGNASYYYSFTRNEASGTIRTPQGAVSVSGLVWKDHEWSTSALGPEAEGWDWFSLQLDDGREVMFFQIRKSDGRIEPVSSGVIVEADGRTRRLAHAAVQIEVLDYWQSPASKVRYPAKWNLVVPSADISVTITPLIPNQELQTMFVYWEGAVRVEGNQTGFGYVEMTGYADSMQGQF